MATVLKDLFNNTIDVHEKAELEYVFDARSKGTVFITLLSDVTDCDLKINALDSSNATIFVYNTSEQSVNFHVHIDMQHDATVKMGVLDIQNHPFIWNQYVGLQEQGANFEILSGQLCMKDQKKQCDMEVQHLAGHTHGEIRNFAVMFDEGNYQMVANGNINKGCPQAQSHQATRVLTLGKNHTAKVIPLLLIDENEVKASHAMTIGQPDADQLYYLQSRGLTTKQAIGLLSVGYFLPVLDMIDDQELHDQIRVEMERKVGLYESE